MTHLTQAILILVAIVLVIVAIIWFTLKELRKDVIDLAMELLHDEIEQAKSLHPSTFEVKS